MDSNDILNVLKDGEKTQNEIMNRIIGTFNIDDKSKKQYLKIGAQILVESEIEFLLNDLLESGIIGMAKKSSGAIERNYFYIK